MKLPVHDAIENAAYWHRLCDAKGRVLAYRVQFEHAEDSYGESYSIAECAALDRRLPGVLNELHPVSRSPLVQRPALGAVLRASLKYWAAAHPLPKKIGFMRDTSPASDFDCIEGVRNAAAFSSDGQLSIVYSAFHLATTEENDYYASSWDIASADVPSFWLDTHFPGWRQRLETLNALGVTDNLLVQHAFYPDQVPVTEVMTLDIDLP